MGEEREGMEKNFAFRALLLGDDAYAERELLPGDTRGGLEEEFEEALFFLPRRRE